MKNITTLFYSPITNQIYVLCVLNYCETCKRSSKEVLFDNGNVIIDNEKQILKFFIDKKLDLIGDL